MEARATINGAKVSKTFMAAALVLVAMGLAAMGGYVTGSVVKGNGAPPTSTGTLEVHPAAGTVLRQDNPAQAPAELPSWLQQETAPKSDSRIIVDDPSFWRQYLAAPAASTHATGHGYF